jgi:hypothetical protein
MEEKNERDERLMHTLEINIEIDLEIVFTKLSYSR